MAHPILMKKGRPASTLSVLCHPDLADELRQTIYIETTTFGIRHHVVRKHAALRGSAEITVNGDVVAIELTHQNGKIVQATPEFEDIAWAADRQGLPQLHVLDHARSAAAAAGLVEGGILPSHMRHGSGHDLAERCTEPPTPLRPHHVH